MRRPSTARLFVAVDLPAPVLERLASWTRSALGGAEALRAGSAKPRLLDPESMHLTLFFLGDRPTPEIEPLGEAVQGCAHEVGELSLGAPLWLPPRRPRVLAVEVHDRSGGLEALKDELVAALAGVCEPGLEVDRRRFRPHVTVARMPGARPRPRPMTAPGLDGGTRERRLAPTPALSFHPEALVLYRSWLGQGGSRYEALTSRVLAGPAEL